VAIRKGNADRIGAQLSLRLVGAQWAPKGERKDLYWAHGVFRGRRGRWVRVHGGPITHLFQAIRIEAVARKGAVSVSK